MPRPTVLAAWAFAVAAGPLLAGCGLFGSDGAPATTVPGGARTTSTTVPLAGGPELLDAGAEPQQRLRLRLQEGTTTTVDLTVGLDVVQRSGGTEQALNSPPVTETVRFTVGAVDETGAELTFAFTDVSLDRTGSGLTDAEFLTLTAELRSLIGLGGRAHVSERGAVTDLRYREPAGLDASVAATLDQFEGQLGALTPTLPVEPVGVGARWRAESTVTASGITVAQVTTYELTAISADEIRYTTSIEQSAEPQDIDLPGLPAGTEARLVSASTTGTGTATLTPTSPVATGSAKQTGTQVIELTEAKVAPTKLEQQLTLALSIEPAG